MRATFLRLLISWFRRPAVGGAQTLPVRGGGRSEAAKTSRIRFTISTLGRPPGPPERLLASLVAGEESPPPGSPAASLRTISSRKSGAFSTEPPRVSRRLQSLRGWSHENHKKVSQGGPGTGRTHGLGPLRGVQLCMGHNALYRL